MLDHVGIEVSDLARSKAFHEAALMLLGIRLTMEPVEGSAGFGADAGSTQRSGRYSPPWKTSGSPAAVSSSRTAPVRIT
jgi:hypothetical protein